MDTLIDSTLSAELQENYLEKKELRLDLLFPEDEFHFCQNIFNQVLSEKVERESLPKIEMISFTLNVILERRRQLKDSLQSQKCELKKLLEGDSMEVKVSMFKTEDAIIDEILLLINAEKLIKEDLLALVKRQQLNKLPIVQAKVLNANRYHI
ncbi:hypothetical protein [Pedobacter psychroterrae]|uniref:Uncharacterized protein n=1 Tax=Pedobacter psychroterrae TaxID=2530453 RepID=A0A4R0NMT0_9SPHI|nr:hypothetical protein [Pedobacter psychroterrae]TCD01539.1 hypothetical protein EZ437_12445 [Pedobacter psychroterrae]